MGRMAAEDMVAHTDRATALRWHLTSNHYPPIHEVFMPIAERAIELAQDEEWDTILDLPNGKRLSVAEVIEGLHLDCFLNE